MIYIYTGFGLALLFTIQNTLFCLVNGRSVGAINLVVGIVQGMLGAILLLILQQVSL